MTINKIIYGFIIDWNMAKDIFNSDLYPELYDIDNDNNEQDINAEMIVKTDWNYDIYLNNETKKYINLTDHIKISILGFEDSSVFETDGAIIIGIVLSELEVRYNGFTSIPKIHQYHSIILNRFLDQNPLIKSNQNINIDLYSFVWTDKQRF